MFIKYLIVRESKDVDRLPKLDATTIGAVINHPEYNLRLSLRDTLGIILEQSILSDYLLNMNPDSQELKKYRDNCTRSINKYVKNRSILKEQLKQEDITELEFNNIYNHVVNNVKLIGPSLDNVIFKFLKNGSRYTTIPTNFLIPYLREHEYYDPVVLSPVYRKDHEDDSLGVTFYCKHYTSTIVDKDKSLHVNPTLNYICSMNHVGKHWKELIDTIQSMQIPVRARVGSESLSNILNDYFHNRELSIYTDKKTYKDTLLDILRYVHIRDNIGLLSDEEDTEELVSLFSYLGDNRLRYLLEEDPIVAATESWYMQKDLAFLVDIHDLKKPYVMAASEEDAGDEPEDTSDDEAVDDDTSTDDDDSEDEEESEEDLFSDDDDFADDAEDSGDDESGSSSSNEQTDNSSSEESNNEEDVNPIIELIEDETFDEYLDRGILKARIRKLISSPPKSIRPSEIRFLKYWYLQWFPCTSVDTTRKILGSILKVSPRRLTSS